VQWCRAVRQQCQIWIFCLLYHVFYCSHRPFCEAITLRHFRATCDVRKPILCCKAFENSSAVAPYVVSVNYIRYTVSREYCFLCVFLNFRPLNLQVLKFQYTEKNSQHLISLAFNFKQITGYTFPGTFGKLKWHQWFCMVTLTFNAFLT
jgi:hypothetical protein